MMKLDIASEVMKKRKLKKMADGGEIQTGLDNGSDGDPQIEEKTLKALADSVPTEDEEDPDTKVKNRIKRIFARS